MTTSRSHARRDLAVAIHAAAVAGVDPRVATLGAVRARLVDVTEPVSILALGKASAAMAQAAVEALAARRIQPARGLVVGTEAGPPPHPRLVTVAGDHPVPNAASAAAAAAVATCADQIAGDGTVFVLLSGGATSLVAAPIEGVDERDLARLFDGLLGSGVDITVMNAIRKRFTRWGAGRLARALAPARVHCLIVSDVVGDDIPSIGSGPCAPDPLDAADVLALIDREGLESYVPRALRDVLAAESTAGEPPATAPPRRDDPAFANVECEVILGNRVALAHAAETARQLGVAPVKVVGEPLLDDAVLTAQRLVDELIRFREAGLPDARGEAEGAEVACMMWGGETTVRLGTGDVPPGGRCQELALAAADALRAEGARGVGITLLAAGTDGRDGPTDAAGAIVDADTWDTIHSSGRDPDEDLVEHRSYAALDAAGALLRTGASGTNVGDVVIGIVERTPPRAAGLADIADTTR